MNRLTRTSSWGLALAAAIVSGVPSTARAADSSMNADIPFAFIVGTIHLPPGRYVVSEVSENPSVLLVARKDGGAAAFSLSIPSAGASISGRPELTFARVGGQYFLSGVALDSDTRGIIVTLADIEQGLAAADRP
jgi:hypothetical protein